MLSMWRTDVAPFDGRERALLEEFAVQGAIVLRQVELMRALELRSGELASKVAQLEALREVGEAVSSSLDLDEVLHRIVSNAVRLTNTDGGSSWSTTSRDGSFHVRTAFGGSPALLDELRSITIRRETTLVGRTATERASRCRCATSPTSTATRISRSSSGTGGDPSWPRRCCAATGSSGCW